MNAAEIIEALRARLAVPVGRHLYGVLGPYPALRAFEAALEEARQPDGSAFSSPVSVSAGILAAIPDEEFRYLLEREISYPEPTRKHVADAFERFLRACPTAEGLVVLKDLELVFAYHLELTPLRVLATDQDRFLLLLPGRAEGGSVRLFAEAEGAHYTLPAGVVAENHLWQLDD